MFGKKKSANFCRAHRLWIGYQYHRAHTRRFESFLSSDFVDWVRMEYGARIHRAFLNEILEEFLEYEKDHPNGEGIVEMLAKIHLQRKNWEEEYYRKMRAENRTTGSDFHISW